MKCRGSCSRPGIMASSRCGCGRPLGAGLLSEGPVEPDAQDQDAQAFCGLPAQPLRSNFGPETILELQEHVHKVLAAHGVDLPGIKIFRVGNHGWSSAKSGIDFECQG